MNGVLYNECLYGCALEPDLQILLGGDLTEIGEKVRGHCCTYTLQPIASVDVAC